MHQLFVAGNRAQADSTDYNTDDDDDDNEAEAGACSWSEWSEWTECTVTCGRGFIIRHRTADKSDSCTRSTVEHQQKPCRTHAVCVIRPYLYFCLALFSRK